MLYTIAVILVVLWLFGLVSSYTMGGFIHVLLVIAVVVILIQLIQGRRAITARSRFFRKAEMSAIKIAAIVLIVAGVLGLAYGSFSYTKETHHATVGPIDLSVKERETFNVPVWAGVGAIVAGGALLLLGFSRR